MFSEIVCGIVILVILFIYWSSSTFKFWVERGVPGPKPTALIGNFGDVLKGKLSMGEWIRSYYDKYEDELLIGIFLRRRPVVIIRDLDLIRDVMIRDFSKFTDRPVGLFERSDPLSQNLLHLEYARWRPLRTKFSPIFNCGKLEEMFYLLLNCGDQLQDFMSRVIAENNVLEARDFTSKYIIDVIGTCVFGLELKDLADGNCEFWKMGHYLFSINWKKIILFQLREFAPSLVEFLGPLVEDKKLTNFFVTIMNKTIKFRRENKIVKHDFIDFLINVQDNPKKLPGIKLSDSFLASQLFIFFTAGFETSSTTMSHVLYELAQHHNIQHKLRKEIRKTKRRNNGKLSYHSVENMKYMEMVLKETLRKYPPIMLLLRGANAPYTFIGTNVTIPKGQQIFISVYGIHHDPKIYPNPENFNPENFSEEAIKSRHPMSFLPFGDGPRNCIGMRFGQQQIKVGLIKILEHYRVDVCKETDISYKIDPRGFLMAPLNGIYLKFNKL